MVGTALKWGDVGWTGGEPGNGKLGRHGSILQLLLPNSVVDFGTTRPLLPGPVDQFCPSLRPLQALGQTLESCFSTLTDSGEPD